MIWIVFGPMSINEGKMIAGCGQVRGPEAREEGMGCFGLWGYPSAPTVFPTPFTMSVIWFGTNLYVMIAQKAITDYA
jgi:hypothetical protein